MISIGNLPKLRTDGISAILSLLESRYELAEAVLFHRTKMNATAMLERALSFCIPQSKIAKSRGKAGKAKSVAGTNPLTEDEEKENRRNVLERWLIENPEEALLPALLNGTGPVKAADVSGVMKSDWERGQKLVSRLLRRDLYEPFMIVAYDEFEGRDVHSIQAMYGDDENAPANRAKALRLLEEDFDLPPGSIVMYCPESRMNKKIAEVQLFVENIVERFDKFEAENANALSAGHLSAQLDRFKRLWKIGFFVDPNVRAEKGDAFLNELGYAIRAFILNLYPRHVTLETEAARIAHNVVGIPTFHLYGKSALASPVRLQTARSDASVVTEVYPTKARRLTDFIRNESSSDSGNAEESTSRT